MASPLASPQAIAPVPRTIFCLLMEEASPAHTTGVMAATTQLTLVAARHSSSLLRVLFRVAFALESIGQVATGMMTSPSAHAATRSLVRLATILAGGSPQITRTAVTVGRLQLGMPLQSQ